MTTDQTGYEPVDETTAVGERRAGEERRDRADEGVSRTNALLRRARAAAAEIRDMHEANHYYPVLLKIMQGTHR